MKNVLTSMDTGICVQLDDIIVMYQVHFACAEQLWLSGFRTYHTPAY